MAPKGPTLQLRKLKMEAKERKIAAEQTHHMQIIIVDVNQVLFSQSSISSVFDNQESLLQCVSELLQERYEGDEDWMVLEVYRSPQTPANVYISQNNRRLFCFKLLRFAQSHIRVRVSTHGKVKQNVEKCTRIRSLEFGTATFDISCQLIWLRHKADGSASILKVQHDLRKRLLFRGLPFCMLADLFPMEMEISHNICFEGNTARIQTICHKGKVGSVAQQCTLFQPCILHLEAYREQRMQLWSKWHKLVSKVLGSDRLSACAF